MSGTAPAERTALAWQRTGLGVVGSAALLAHTGRAVAWAPALVAGVALLVVAETRLRRIEEQVGAGRVEAARTPAVAAVLAVLLVAVVGALVVLAGGS